MFRQLTRGSTVAIAALGAYQINQYNNQTFAESKKNKLVQMRTQDFNLSQHHHGKAKIRVLKVRRTPTSHGERHSVSEYTVHTTLYCPDYEKVFTKNDNTDLVATDTQKNTIYVVAKRTDAETPEQFGIDIASHFLKHYPMLTAVQIDVDETLWHREEIDGESHNHAFTKTTPEENIARVRMCRGSDVPEVRSEIRDMTILKTTQSGFENHLQNDQYTLLPNTDDRCLSTRLTAKWNFNARHVDYAKARSTIRNELLKALFGPADTGVYSVSLQATIYDAGCLALKALPELEKINITTPNVHYLPTEKLLSDLKVTKPGEKVKDVFIPISEPSGMIFCEVKR